MGHLAITQVMNRAELAKSDSDFTHFFNLLLAGEALAKLVILGMVASIADDKDRNRYRLEHQLVRADGMGDWGRVLEDALVGPASQFLLVDARREQNELTKPGKADDWQYSATKKLSLALDALGIESEEVPVKTDLRRWFRLFSTLRNKSRAHGATMPLKASAAAPLIEESIKIILENFSLFSRQWAYLHRNLSGKYRISPITNDATLFSHLTKTSGDNQPPNGVYVHIGTPRRLTLLHSDPDLQDFYFANGGLTSKKYELLSYYSDNKRDGDAAAFLVPPGTLPSSETEGFNELLVNGNCFTNAPEVAPDYIDRPLLEESLVKVILDERRPVITLLGRGGMGKTSVALKVLRKIYQSNRFDVVVWLSARDVDLHLSGPKPVRPLVLSSDDMSRFYSELVVPDRLKNDKSFDPRAYFEEQLQSCDIGRCLFVFDNFETTQNPIEIFNWIDSFIRLPNKALITTRLREFKGDYPIEVNGMEEPETKKLITQTARALGVESLITHAYTDELLKHSEGHPYVVKMLIGEVAKLGRAANIPQIVAGTEDILTALFERTYATLSPCAQRAFLTLAAWNSPVPKLALEAILFRSTEERNEVEKGIESLLQYSMAELHPSGSTKEEFIGLPLVATIFGKKKLNISPSKSLIISDSEILQMLGPSRKHDIRLTLAKKLETFISNISKKIDAGESFKAYAPILEVICRAYNPGWLLLARWQMELRTSDGYEEAKNTLRQFLENEPEADEAAEAWRLLGHACYQTNDALGEVHAFVERAQSANVPFYDLSNTANRLITFLREQGSEIDRIQRRDLVSRLLAACDVRRSEAEAVDLSRMAWLAIHVGNEDKAREYVLDGLAASPGDYHLDKLAQRLRVDKSAIGNSLAPAMSQT